MKMGAGEKCFLSTIKTFVWRKNSLQKQPPEVFYEDKCSWKFCKIHTKTPVAEALF